MRASARRQGSQQREKVPHDEKVMIGVACGGFGTFSGLSVQPAAERDDGGAARAQVVAQSALFGGSDLNTANETCCLSQGLMNS